MKKIESHFTTLVELTTKEAKEVCRVGQLEKCCAFLTMAPTGWQCVKRDSIAAVIEQRLESGTMKAKGMGGWEGCAWEGEI